MSNTQIQTSQAQVADLNQIHQIGSFGASELMAMKESIAKKLTIPQFNLFMYQMNRMGLDPSLGHGVPILYGQDVNIRIEYEGLKALAQDSEGYKGIYSQAIRAGDDFSAEADDDGVITKVTFKIGKPPRGEVVGSFSVAKREGEKDVIIVCDNDEFEKYVKKNPTFWKLDNGKIDPDMAKKFAATRAVKAQFNIAQVVDDNMLALGSGDTQAAPQRRDITQEADAAAVKPAAIAPPATEPQKLSEDEKKTITKTQISEKLTKLGKVTKEEKGAYIAENTSFADPGNPTLAELQGLSKILDMHLKEKAASDDLLV